jgi:hypothetical protein
MLGHLMAELFECLQRQLDTAEYPHIEELAAGGEPREVFGRIMAATFDEQRFDRGLYRLLDGIALDIERRAGRR